MTDNPLRSALSGLERKMILLINDRQKLNQELKLLKSENKGLKDQIIQKSDAISDFQNKGKMRIDGNEIYGGVDCYLAKINNIKGFIVIPDLSKHDNKIIQPPGVGAG